MPASKMHDDEVTTDAAIVARLVARLTGSPVEFLPNPRAEAGENELDPYKD